MQPKPLAIGLITPSLDGYYFGAMFNGIHQVCRAAGVPLFVILGELRDMRLPLFGTEHVAGWIVLHPRSDVTAKLVALVASGVPVVTVATAPDDVACTS